MLQIAMVVLPLHGITAFQPFIIALYVANVNMQAIRMIWAIFEYFLIIVTSNLFIVHIKEMRLTVRRIFQAALGAYAPAAAPAMTIARSKERLRLP